jgi:hypothetical protein
MKKSIKILTLALPFLLGACSKLPDINDPQSGLATINQMKQCQLIKQPDEMADQYSRLLEQKWDRHAVGCGALYVYQLSQQSPFNLELRLEALGAQLGYFDVLNQAYPKLYKSGALGNELNDLWRATRQRSESLIESVEVLDGIIAEINLLKGAYLLASHEQDSSTKDTIKSLPVALELIEDAANRKPEAVEGLPLYLLARLKLTLPSFVGGDTEQAIQLLEGIVNQYPNNLEYQRWLMQGYAATGNVEKEKSLITKASRTLSNDINDQDLVDLYIIFGGSAHRYNMQAEIAFFSTQRKEMFSQNPHLLTRKTGANRGHGGNDPITGTDPNAI